MKSFRPPVLLCLPFLLVLVGETRAYIASVVEFEAEEVKWEDIKEEPFAYFEKNMKKLRGFVSEAKSQGSNIVIFPEYGLQSLMVSNISPNLASDFGQILPEEEDFPQKKSLCDEESVPLSQSLLRDLSCMAQSNEIYIVVNILTMLWNPEEKEFNHFNTNVAFDRTGAIVARYRKFNIYHEPIITNNPLEPDISYFDTDFGPRIGLMTCFDILFDQPAKSLISEEVDVDAIVLTSAWGDELPFLTAPTFHPGAARMLGTTILSSGHHYLKGGVTGSGIYSPGRVLKYSWNEEPTLLTVSVNSSDIFPHYDEFVNPPKFGMEDLHGYTFIEIKPGERSLRLYANGTNCSLDYSLRTSEIPSSSGYVLLGKKGGRTFGGIYELDVQVCGVVFCNDLNDKLSCGSPSTVSLKESTFDYISLSGVFVKGTTPAPVSMDQEYRPFLTKKLPFNCEYASNSCTYESNEPLSNLYSFGLYGRIY